MFKVLFFENLGEIGLCIEQFDLGFLKTGAFLTVSIPRVLTERTEVMRFEIVLGKTVLFEKRTTFGGKRSHIFLKVVDRSRLTLKQRTCFLRA